MSIQNLENKPGKNIKLWLYAPVAAAGYQVLKDMRTSSAATVSNDSMGNTR